MTNICKICNKETTMTNIDAQLRKNIVVLRRLIYSKMIKFDLKKKDTICYDCIYE